MTGAGLLEEWRENQFDEFQPNVDRDETAEEGLLLFEGAHSRGEAADVGLQMADAGGVDPQAVFEGARLGHHSPCAVARGVVDVNGC